MEIENILKWIAAITGLVALIKGILEYSKSNKLKSVEYYEKLIKEFDADENDLAKDILDDYFPPGLAKEVGNLPVTLRNHAEKEVTSGNEIKIREGFDNLFSFYAKIEYFLSIRLLTKGELEYFSYYIYKAWKRPEVLEYANRYMFAEIFMIGYVLSLPIKKDYRHNIRFSSLFQRIRYFIYRVPYI